MFTIIVFQQEAIKSSWADARMAWQTLGPRQHSLSTLQMSEMKLSRLSLKQPPLYFYVGKKRSLQPFIFQPQGCYILCEKRVNVLRLETSAATKYAERSHVFFLPRTKPGCLQAGRKNNKTLSNTRPNVLTSGDRGEITLRQKLFYFFQVHCQTTKNDQAEQFVETLPLCMEPCFRYKNMWT